MRIIYEVEGVEKTAPIMRCCFHQIVRDVKSTNFWQDTRASVLLLLDLLCYLLWFGIHCIKGTRKRRRDVLSLISEAKFFV